VGQVIYLPGARSCRLSVGASRFRRPIPQARNRWRHGWLPQGARCRCQVSAWGRLQPPALIRPIAWASRAGRRDW